MSKETFKVFVKEHPELAQAVAANKTSWQKLYETFDLYGKDSPVWQQYQQTDKVREASRNKMGFQELSQLVNGMDLNTIQKGVNGLQKAIGLLQDLTTTNKNEERPPYEERPINKYYED